MSEQRRCLVCGSAHVLERIDLGNHPVSSFFLQSQNDAQKLIRNAIGQCEACGVVQSTAVVPHQDLVPPYDWIVAREPEGHLDEVVARLMQLAGGKDIAVCGLTSVDATTVERFAKQGVSATWQLRPQEDFGIDNRNANVETVQHFLTPQRAQQIASKRGLADIVIARRIADHAENISAFFDGVATLLKPNGLVMVETPDCRACLERKDFAMVWEERTVYLTETTCSSLAALHRFEPIETRVYPSPFEGTLVQIARKGVTAQGVAAPDRTELSLFEGYAKAFEPSRRQIREQLLETKAKVGPIALFGAGHLACAFANYMGVGDLIDFVADDTPQKQNKFLPGARLPILPSSALVERGVKLCLLALSIGNENKVMERNQDYVANGGVFRSIFRESPRSIFDYRP